MDGAGEARILLEAREGRVTVAECRDESLCRRLEEQGYLSREGLCPLEAAYLVARCTAALKGEGCGWPQALGVAGLAGPGELFLVYYDLRRRGRRPRRGVRRMTLLVGQGSGRALEVRVLRGGGPVSIGELIEWSRAAARDDKEPVIAVVDGHGDVTYYTARAVTSFR